MRTKRKVADLDELQETGRILIEVSGLEVGVFRQRDGEYYAIANHCPHQAGPLCEGGLMNETQLNQENNWDWEYAEDRQCIVCPWHGWRFDVKTGDNIEDSDYTVPTYDVEVDDGVIYVIMGDE